MAKSRKPAKDTPETVEDAVVVDEPVAPDVDEAAEKIARDQPEIEPVDGSASEDASDIPNAISEETVDASPDVVEQVTTQPTTRGGSSFLPLLLGGAIAAGLGFGAARYPDQWPFASAPAVDPVQTELASLADRLKGIEGTTATQSEALTALQEDTGIDQLRGEIGGTLDQMRTQFETLSTQLADLEGRVHTVEKLPQGAGMEAAAAAASAYERELQQMRAMLDAELARIGAAQDDAKTLEVSAAETAKAAAARAAMSRVLAALETGRPYGDALFDLTENAGVEPPMSLATHADDGIATLAVLQAGFPEAARDALDASIRAAVDGGNMDRVTAFLRTQLGTRSLTPKEGDDPDAILSRAEAALKDGRIGIALTELEAMPDAGKPALETWIAKAKARNDALEAGQALAQQVNKK